MKEFLKIVDLSCGYPGSFMLKSVSMDISRGTFAGVIGPNGAGKTTLFKSLCGQLPAMHGAIYLHGQDMQRMRAKEKAREVAIVAQNTESIDMSVEDYVLLGRLPYKKHFQFFENRQDYQQAHRFMEMTGVIAYKHKNMCELSGGEQQLAAIARALTQEPSLLLLDEPTSHLDIMHQVHTLNLIQRLNEELGLTVLMIIHDLNLAGEYCNQLFMLSNGAVHVSGDPSQVLHYRHIEDVYETVVVTTENPLSGKPAIFLVSEKVLKSRKA